VNTERTLKIDIEKTRSGLFQAMVPFLEEILITKVIILCYGLFSESIHLKASISIKIKLLVGF